MSQEAINIYICPKGLRSFCDLNTYMNVDILWWLSHQLNIHNIICNINKCLDHSRKVLLHVCHWLKCQYHHVHQSKKLWQHNKKKCLQQRFERHYRSVNWEWRINFVLYSRLHLIRTPDKPKNCFIQTKMLRTK